MEQNRELRLAWDFVEHTGTSIFLTGKAGTGKTTFLRAVKERSSKRMIVVAPTGVAAINAQGVTIHSFFQLPPQPYVPGTQVKDRYDFSKEKRRIIQTLDMVVIDEISMVRADLLDAVDNVLRRYRDHTQPFGGVQLLMIGDLQQLTPVVRPEDERLLGQYYDTPYFFGSKALQQISYVTIQLTHVYRQQDEAFITILNHIRDGQPTADDLATLNAHCRPAFIPKAEDGYIRLTTHNRMADSYNETELLKLHGAPHRYEAKIEKDFPASIYPAEPRLLLKEGAQVMFIKNDASGAHRYYNGRIGHVVGFDAEKGHILVLCPGDEHAIAVEPQQWENTKYEINPETKVIEPHVVGTFTQFPLRLAWAITIHKSQGLTFERAIIDAGQSFAPGQVYVALSRCKSLDGLVLATPLQPYNVINDQRVKDYISRQQTAAEESIRQLPALKEEYYRYQLLDMFNFTALFSAQQMLYRTLVEHFRSNRNLTDFHRQAQQTMKTNVMDVAYRWLAVIRQTPMDGLHADAFLERVQHSETYFLGQLRTVFPDLLMKTKTARSQSERVMEELDERYKELQTLYLAKAKLFEKFGDETFTVAGYMQMKQETMLDAMEEVNPDMRRPRRSRRRSGDSPFDDPETLRQATQARVDRDKIAGTNVSTRERKPRQQKGASQQESLRLLQEGKTVAQIAQERGLVEGTIFGHLAHFVREGKLTVAQVIGDSKMRAITHAIAQLDEVTVDKVQEICRADITRAEIYFVINLMRPSRS